MSKATTHQLFLDILVETFPDATLIYTYRPLRQAFASAFSLFKYVMEPKGIDTNHPDFLKR